MWIIASIPFWILGFSFFVVGLVGIGDTMQRAAEKTDKEITKAAWNIIGLMGGAGTLFLIAAKIAS
jgi:hypothetical protein